MTYDSHMTGSATKGKTMKAASDTYYADRYAAIQRARETRLTYEQRAWLDAHLIGAYPDGDGMRYQRSNGVGGKRAELRFVDGAWVLIRAVDFAECSNVETERVESLRSGLKAMVAYLDLSHLAR